MAEYQLKNQELTLKISSKGAEMKSLKDNKTNQEYLWHGDSAYWGRTSPVLFPIVGNYREKESVFEGKTYSMSQHGFARDMEFTLESQKEEEIWFELKENEETLKKYPFAFRLHLGYRLDGRSVEVLWKVENPNEKKMYFSMLDTIDLIKKVPENMAEKIAEMFFSPIVSEKRTKLYKTLYANLVNISAEKIDTIVKIGRIIFGRENAIEILKNIDIQVVFITGEYDIPRPFEEAREMANYVKDSKLFLVENAGHISNLENYDRVNEIFKEILNI